MPPIPSLLLLLLGPLGFRSLADFTRAGLQCRIIPTGSHHLHGDLVTALFQLVNFAEDLLDFSLFFGDFLFVT